MPVRIDRAVVPPYSAADLPMLYIHDGHAAIYVHSAGPDLDLHPGSAVRVSGVTDPGEFSPSSPAPT